MNESRQVTSHFCNSCGAIEAPHSSNINQRLQHCLHVGTDPVVYRVQFHHARLVVDHQLLQRVPHSHTEVVSGGENACDPWSLFSVFFEHSTYKRTNSVKQNLANKLMSMW